MTDQTTVTISGPTVTSNAPWTVQASNAFYKPAPAARTRPARELNPRVHSKHWRSVLVRPSSSPLDQIQWYWDTPGPINYSAHGSLGSCRTPLQVPDKPPHAYPTTRVLSGRTCKPIPWYQLKSTSLSLGITLMWPGVGRIYPISTRVMPVSCHSHV